MSVRQSRLFAASPWPMTPLEEVLARRIRAQGPLTVAEFMAEALGHPEYGYYATRDPLGRRGDFTTAPDAVTPTSLNPFSTKNGTASW